MKKLLFLLLLITLPTAGVAQTINVHMKNGETVKYNSSDVDFLDFSESGQQSSSDKYGISGGVRVNYGKKIYSIFNYLHGDEHIATYDAFDRLYKIEIIGKYNIEWEFDYSNKTINCIFGGAEVSVFFVCKWEEWW